MMMTYVMVNTLVNCGDGGIGLGTWRERAHMRGRTRRKAGEAGMEIVAVEDVVGGWQRKTGQVEGERLRRAKEKR